MCRDFFVLCLKSRGERMADSPAPEAPGGGVDEQGFAKPTPRRKRSAKEKRLARAEPYDPKKVAQAIRIMSLGT